MPKFPPIPGARTVTTEASSEIGKVHCGLDNGLKNVAARPVMQEESKRIDASNQQVRVGERTEAAADVDMQTTTKTTTTTMKIV